MPFKTALSASEQTAKRSGIYSAIRYVAVNTPSVQLQFNPSVAASGQAAAQIGFSTTLQGSTANVLIGMTVYVTPTSDYRADLINQPENCLKTYVRKSPTSAILYIGWTAFQWTTASYVTVVSNFEPALKKTRIVGTTIYKDVDIAYREPLPRIYGWYHHVIVTSENTVNYSPTITEEAMASGAAISSRTWATVISGTVTTGVSTSATPTFSLSLGVHWLHCTTSDDNGNDNWIALMVAVVPDSYASVVTELVAGTVTNSLTSGIEADIVTTTDITVVPGSAALIFDDIVYKGNWREQVVKAFGWLDGEVEQSIGGDAQYGLRTEYRTRLLGIRPLTQTLRITAFPFKHNASPATWGQVARCTVYDAIWYALSEHSTLASLSAIDFPASYTDYQYNPGIQIPEGAILDSVDALAFFASGGMVNHSPNGELYFRQSLLYATSGRDSATVYATYETQDGTVWRKTYPPVNRFPLSAIRAGFATFNTTTNRPNIYNSLAPAEATPTALQETLDGIIMTKNLSNANANIEAGKLAINHFFASVEAAGVGAELIAGYSTVHPSCFQWHKFTLGAGETLDGSSLDSSSRFLCLQVSSTYDKDTWGIVNNADFREETDGGSNYARETEFVPLGTDVTYPTYPTGIYSVYLDDFDVPTDTYGNDYDGQREGWEDPTVDPETAAENGNDNTGVDETLYVPLAGGVVSSDSHAAGDYLIRVSGSGRISSASGASASYFFTDGDEGWSALTSSDSDVGAAATPASGAAGSLTVNGWIASDYTQVNTSIVRAIYVHIDLATPITVPSGETITATFDYTQGSHGSLFTAWRMQTKDSGGTWTDRVVIAGGSTTDGTDKQIVWTASSATEIHGIAILIRTDHNGGFGPGWSPSGSALLKRVIVSGAVAAFADAAWYTEDDWETVSQAPNDTFLYLEAAAIPELAALEFNSSHVYEFALTWAGGVMDWSFTDSYDSEYSLNSGTLRVEIIPV